MYNSLIVFLYDDNFKRRMYVLLILFKSMVTGETGHQSLSVLSHVAEVHRHVDGNVTIRVRLMMELFVPEMKRSLKAVTQTFVQVNRK